MIALSVVLASLIDRVRTDPPDRVDWALGRSKIGPFCEPRFASFFLVTACRFISLTAGELRDARIVQLAPRRAVEPTLEPAFFIHDRLDPKPK